MWLRSTINVKLWRAYSRIGDSLYGTVCFCDGGQTANDSESSSHSSHVSSIHFRFWTERGGGGGWCLYVGTAAPTKFCLETPLLFFLNFKAITVCPPSAVYSSYVDWWAFTNTEMILCWLKQVCLVSTLLSLFSCSCDCCCFYQKWSKSCLYSVDFGLFNCDTRVSETTAQVIV